MNARSIRNKVLELSILVEDTNPDIILVTETWLDSNFENSFLCLDNFIIHRKDRAEGSDPHGGVMVCIRSDIHANIIEIDTYKEICFVNLIIKDFRIKVGVVYRPPSTNASDSSDLSRIMRDQLQDCSSFVVFGDFNFPGINWEYMTSSTSMERHFLEICDEIGVFQIIREPTTQHFSVLDLCLCSSREIVTDVCIGECFSTSDHSIITCKIKIPRARENKKLEVHQFKNADWEMVRMNLALIDWNSFFSDSQDIEDTWMRFRNYLNNLTLKHLLP